LGFSLSLSGWFEFCLLVVGGWWWGEEECRDLSFWVLPKRKEQERKLAASNLEGKKHKNPQNPIGNHLTLIIIIIII